MTVYKWTSFLLFLLFLNARNCLADYKENDYDYIIVGASAAGCVLANRLSANGAYKVLLLEAGGEPTILSHVPGFAVFAFFTGSVKHYLMEKQDNAGLGAEGQRISAARGIGLGGSTSIDDLIYVRGNKLDYDRWESIGNPGWSYEEVLPYFKKIENSMISYVDSKARGVRGPVDVSEVPTRTESVHAFIQAVKESGTNFSTDYNNGELSGVGYIQIIMKNGRRTSAEKAYLRPAYGRPNLTIKTKALVTRILINPQTKVAEGVVYEQGLSSQTGKAKKEVVLSAGGIGSPRLLLLSGIGPKGHLKEVGVSPIHDLPVGETLEDHFQYPCLTFTVNQSIDTTLLRFADPINLFEWAFHGKGPWTVPAVILEAAGNINVEVDDLKEVSIFFGSGAFNTDLGLFARRQFRIGDEAYKKIYRPLIGKHVFSVFVVLVRPESKGKIRLKSNDPHDDPLLYGNYVSDPENKDVKRLIKAIRIVQKIVDTPALKKYGAEQVFTATPGCEGYEADSDDFWECQIRHLGVSDWHPMSGCKMGPKNDPSTVVDNELRVHGVEKLRVADASVIPFSLTAKTTAPAYMIGEKAADIILSSAGH